MKIVYRRKKQLALVRQVGEPSFQGASGYFNPLRWGHQLKRLFLQFIPTYSPGPCQDGVLPGYDNALLGQGEGNVAAVIERIEQLGFCETYILENDYI